MKRPTRVPEPAVVRSVLVAITGIAAAKGFAFAPDGDRIVALRGNAFLRNRTFSEFGGLRIPLDLVWLPAGGGPHRRPRRGPAVSGGGAPT